MYYLLLFCVVSCLYNGIICSSNFDPNKWRNAKTCKLKSGVEGRCVGFEFCPELREQGDDPLCGTQESPGYCCESTSQDFKEISYGRVAKQACNKYMNNIDWKLHGYVLGGTNARDKEFTFMAALGYGANVSDIKFQCGGSLISDRHVLTAAHCLYSLQDGPVRYVLLGDLDINSTTDIAEPQYHYIQNVTVHPQYKTSSTYHDIAILHLFRPANFTPYVQPACLDYGQLSSEVNLTKFYATGWGFIDTEGNRASHMQEVGLVQYDFDRCSKAYPMNRRKLAMGLVDSQMCAGAKYMEKKDTCQGDSGGPLSRTNDDIRYNRYKGYIVSGVTSFGKLCGYTKAPGVYTRVEKYIPWIESVVWPDEVAAMQESLQVVPQIQQQDGSTSSTTKPTELNSNDDKAVPDRTNHHVVIKLNSTTPESSVAVTVSIHTNSTRKPINLIDVHYFSDKK